MDEYQPRTVDAELDQLLNGLPAIVLEGPKGVGKTATASRRAQHVLALDEAGVRTIVAADLTRLDRLGGPVLVDEWQRVPEVWDAVRRSVDRDYSPGRFLLTGSAAPISQPTHSGAGRIVSLRMRPMSLEERGLSPAAVSLSALLAGDRPRLDAESPVGLADYAEEIVASGYPSIRRLTDRSRRAALDGYLQRIVERDFPDQGYVVRRPAMLRSWLTAYAAATSLTTSYNTILRAASVEGDVPNRITASSYREVLSRLWILDPVPGWLPSRNQLQRLTQVEKHQLADPGLSARLLGVGVGALLDGSATSPIVRDGHLLGALFESLVTLCVRVAAQAAEARVSHLRTKGGEHEVDLIVERDDHRVLALEVKVARTVEDRHVRQLRWLKGQLGDDLIDAAVITTGQYAYRRDDGIAVIPAALLGQ